MLTSVNRDAGDGEHPQGQWELENGTEVHDLVLPTIVFFLLHFARLLASRERSIVLASCQRCSLAVLHSVAGSGAAPAVYITDFEVDHGS